MAKIPATFSDGAQLFWEDGQVWGDELRLSTLPRIARLARIGQTMPEGPPMDLTRVETDPQAFIALVPLIRPGADSGTDGTCNVETHEPSSFSTAVALALTAVSEMASRPVDMFMRIRYAFRCTCDGEAAWALAGIATTIRPQASSTPATR